MELGAGARTIGKLAKRAGMGGMAIMAGAALMTKVIGVFQKIPLQNLAGDRVFGLYNAVYPFYQLVVVLATAGLPTAVSLMIAERLRSGGGNEDTRRILRAALLVLGATGIGAFAIMWISADWTAKLIGDTGAAGAIRSVSLALLVAPLVAALRGYAQGLGHMQLSAVSQIGEQFVRVGVMVAVLIAGLSSGWLDEEIAAGVMSGSGLGAFAALLLLAFLMRRGSGWGNSRRKASLSLPDHASREAARGVAGARGERPRNRSLVGEMRALTAVALPVALGAVVVPMLGVVDSFTVPRLLRNDGLNEAEAMALFGIYSRAQPLVQLVVMVAGAAAAAAVPGLALARVRGAGGQLGMQLSLVMRMAWTLGAAAALGLAMLAESMNVMLYADAQGTRMFALVGLSALFGCINAVHAPVLQAMRSMRISVGLVLLATALKGVLNGLLIPAMGAEGAAAAGLLALGASALLGTWAIGSAAKAVGAGRAGLRPESARRGARRPAAAAWLARLRPAASAIAALAAMTAALVLTERALGGPFGLWLPPRAAAAALALTGTAVGACVFGAAALRGGVVGAREWRALPGGGVWAARLRRWRLIPPAD